MYNNSYGIRIYNSDPMIENNIIFSTGDNNQYGIYEDDANSDPSSVQNNDIYGCDTALYYDEGTTAIDNATGLNLLSEAEENSSVDPALEDEAGFDWHLTSSTPATITTGGLNGYDESWSYFPELDLVFIDKDGVLRPASGTDWALGAYQYVP